jgi:erythronate-4-phosphate dehydrogenase
MLIVADENLHGVASALADVGEVRCRPGRELRRDDLREAEILLVRSVTPVDAALLEDTPVRFVGSATIGTDHVDLDYLERSGIAFANAPGCNAEAAAEYVLSALLVLRERLPGPLHTCTAGIVGHGNVGTRVRHKLEALGITCLVNDPPLADAGAPGEFVPLEALSDCDVLTLHVPLTEQGPYRTRHLLDAVRLASLKSAGLLINTARGPVVDNRALLEQLTRGRGPTTVLDVWEGEPRVAEPLLRRVALGTPHIAGYSVDGKLRGTVMVYEALCRFLGREPTWSPWDKLPEPPEPVLELAPGLDRVEAAAAAVLHCYDLRSDDRRLRDALERKDTDRAQAFDALRRDYPMRREFAAYRVLSPDPATRRVLQNLGFEA